MPDTQEMMKLAERLEQASGPDRALDYDIAHFATRAHMETGKAPAYTSSLDAAMLLAPEGCAWSVSNVGPNDKPQACVTLWDGACTDIEGDAATPALALAAASLRARANGGGE